MKKSIFTLTAVFAAALIFFVYILKIPANSITAFFLAPFSNLFYFGNMLNWAATFTCIALGSAIALKAGLFNLGGDGQIYLSAFVATTALNNYAGRFHVFYFAIAAISAIAAAGAMTLASGILKRKLKIPELLSSFLLSLAIIPVIDYFISVSLRNSDGNLLALPQIQYVFRLKSILPPSYLNASVYVILCVAAVLGFFLRFTAPGYRLSVTGKSEEFAFANGISTGRIQVFAMLASGALHGLAGFFAVVGSYYTCYQGFYAGLGWGGLAVALLAGSDPFAIPFAALFYAYLETAADGAAMEAATSFNVSSIIQAIIFLFVSSRAFLSYGKRRREQG